MVNQADLFAKRIGHRLTIGFVLIIKFVSKRDLGFIKRTNKEVWLPLLNQAGYIP